MVPHEDPEQAEDSSTWFKQKLKTYDDKPKPAWFKHENPTMQKCVVLPTSKFPIGRGS